jgi:predicted SnoaL-like aldol condensation-catalyzing enzyme
MTLTNKELAVSFWHAIFTEHDAIKASTFISDQYKQHNPSMPDLKEGFIQHFSTILSKPEYACLYTEIKLVIEEDDKVFIHSITGVKNRENDYGKAHADIFKIENGLIVEHWDVVQKIQPQKNSNTTTSCFKRKNIGIYRLT